MKNLVIAFLSTTFILAAGTAVFAVGNGNHSNPLNFEDMLPYMEKAHPNSSKEKLENMYKACHGNDPSETSVEQQNMMNRF